MDQHSDSALVELAKAGDQQAFAELYTRWFDPVYDFVARMMRNRDEAADVAQDTFLKAMNALGGLQKGASFKSWIFTIARNTALNRMEKSSRTRPLVYEDDEGEQVSLDVIDTDRLGSPEEAAEVKAIASLVWEAAAGLDPRQLSLLDLHLRQGLDSAEIADVLGVTKNNGYVMLNRLKKAVEDAIGAFIMFKDGRRYCDDLDALLAEANIAAMSPEVRKLVDRHVARCPECEERKKKLAPLAAFGAFAAVPVPGHVKAHILEGLVREWPGPAAASGGGDVPPPPDSGLGPLPGDEGSGDSTFSAKFLKRGGRFIIGGGIAALLMLGAVLVPASPLSPFEDGATSAQQDPGDGSPAAMVPTATPTPTTTALQQGGVTPSATATETGTPPASLPAGAPTNTPDIPTSPAGAPTSTATRVPPTATRTPTATATSTRPPTSTPTTPPTATATPVPCTPSLSTNLGGSALPIPPGGSSFFYLYASCGTANYTVAGGSGWAITAGSGTVSFGSPRRIDVSVDASGLPEGTHSTTLQIAGPGNIASVTVMTTVGGAAPTISSFSASCSGTTVTFSAAITDDIAVASASVSYTISPTNDTGTVQLQQSGNLWTATITLATPSMTVSSATLTARDGADRTSSATTSC